MVIVDAMACGLPIAAFRSEEFPVVSDGGGELPYNYPYVTSNYNEFINCIFQLIESTQIRKKAGEQLYNYYKQKYHSFCLKCAVEVHLKHMYILFQLYDNNRQ